MFAHDLLAPVDLPDVCPARHGGGQCAHLQIRRSLRQRHLFQHPGAWRQAQRIAAGAINPNIASSAVLSNRDSKQVVNVRPEPASSASAARAGNGGASGSAPAAGQYPVIDGATQRNRDASRARILQDELDNEQRALTNARRMLQETERYAKPDSALLRGLRDSVLEREKNIAALQREIGRR